MRSDSRPVFCGMLPALLRASCRARRYKTGLWHCLPILAQNGMFMIGGSELELQSNLLVDRRGVAVLADFGFTRIRHDDTRTGSRSTGIGTPRYVAPEIFSCEVPRGTMSTDVYASAVTIWSLASAEWPFGGVNDFGISKRVMDGERPPMPTKFGSFQGDSKPAEFIWNLMERMWHQNPERRPPILVVKNELERIGNDGSIVVVENAESADFMLSSSLEVGSTRSTICLTTFQPLLFCRLCRLFITIRSSSRDPLDPSSRWHHRGSGILFLLRAQGPVNPMAVHAPACLIIGHLCQHLRILRFLPPSEQQKIILLPRDPCAPSPHPSQGLLAVFQLNPARHRALALKRLHRSS